MFNNKWKVAFLTLVGVLVVCIIFLAIMIFKPVEKSPIIKKKEREEVPFAVTTNREDLTKLINHYLEKEGLNGPIHYEINIADQVELYGTLPIFNTDIQMKLSFEPIALENGDLLLKQKEISIGQLPLPVSYVMNFIANQYKFPEWVDINPEDEEIYVHLTKMDLKNGMLIEAKTFDLEQNIIQFNLLLPTE
ncbi:YpmS family protein [Niallia sp. RD1]|uniref:YpmS family protein n=1 Tax=Niallia sp. RD1 TaxID=2962858 RepID=UPI0020C1AA89|nr:YpmS family protein [Niallia sp. RD1]UTI41435.1 YpmS family protein [Niallia sp. RD1]